MNRREQERELDLLHDVDAAYDGDDSEEFDGCIECWEEFRYDDTGGYNPPCKCGLHCGRCHELFEAREQGWDEDYPDDRDVNEDLDP